jgi:hypothetical protein
MTSVNAQYRTFIANMRRITGLGADEMGSAPDERHLAGGGYHVGVEDIQGFGRWNTDYSTRQQRDRLDGTNDSSAFDVGDDWPNGGRPAWLRFNGLFLRQLQARDPALAAVRAINFSPDGTLCRRYDTFNRAQGVIASTDSVYMHTHGETWRDQAGTAALDRAFRRVEQMADAAIRNVALPPEGGLFMALTDEQQHDLWTWLAAMMDPTARTDDRFHFPPPFRALNARLAAVEGALAASAQREQDMLAALTATLAQGSGNVDVAAILARIDQRTADVTGLLGQQAARIADLEAELEQARHAQHAAAQAALDATADGS